ncbi:MAG: HAD family hydrolase [Pauljensenia sp.]
MPPSLVCVDIDGTLINSRQEVPESSREAVRAGIDAGNVFVLCTGRSLPEIYPWVWDLGFEGIIAGAGAFTRMGEHIVSDHRISGEDLRVVSSWLDGQDLPWAWQTPTRLHPSESFMEAFTGAAGAEDADPDDDWTPYLHQVSKAVCHVLPDSASKGIFMVPTGRTLDPDVVPRVTRGRVRTISGSVEAASGTTCEILLSGVDKGSALVGLAEHLRIPLTRTVAIGDSVNDIEALGAAGIGVAMGNASPAVQEVADLVTDDIDEDGLAHALRRLGLTA